MTNESSEVKVFLSHSHSDEKIAGIIHDWINKTFRGLISVFRSSDRGDSIEIGDDIKIRIKTALEDSVASIILLSRVSLNKPWIHIEFGASWILNINLIPICLPGLEVKDLPFQFSGIKVCQISDAENCIELLKCLLDRVRTKYPIYKLSNKEIEVEGKKLHKEINKFLGPPRKQDEPPPERSTVWIFGSYSSLNDFEKNIVQKLVSIIPPGLAKLRIRVVMGESDMLQEFAKNFRDAVISSDIHLPNPIILPGKLRQRNLRYLFKDTIGTVPDLAILMGGGVERGRVQEEYDCAIEANIPVLPIPCTGGVAKQVKSTADKASEYSGILYKTGTNIDAGDIANAILKTVEKYKTNK